MTYYQTFESPIGPLFAISDGESLTGLYMNDPDVEPDWVDDEVEVLAKTRHQLEAYFSKRLHRFDLPLAPGGTPFQRKVWDLLCEIPYGQTISYGELARRAGNPNASRAVGLANGQNPISIVIPCHRVVGTNGRLVGYGGGIDKKRALLELEAGSLFDL